MSCVPLNRDMIALGIRQPWAKLILHGIKTIEVRSRDTAQWVPIYLYASKKISEIAPAAAAASKYCLDLETLPRGVIVGTIELREISPCRRSDAQAVCVPRSYLKNRFAWHIVGPVRFDQPLTVRFLPYGVWFYLWKRRNRQCRLRRVAGREG